MSSLLPEPDLSQYRDIGTLATWSVSSSKPNYGVKHLSDPNLKTLWQSEGAQPHLINIQFSRRLPISLISLYAAISLDDSYTPSKLSMRVGSFHGDLKEVKFVELGRPEGWQHVRIGSEVEPIRAHLVQIAIISNHMNGKDTHVRGVKVWAPKGPQIESDDADETELIMPWKSTEFSKHETIR